MQALDFTAKQKIAAEPMGATNIFISCCKTNILHIISRFYLRIRILFIFAGGYYLWKNRNLLNLYDILSASD